MICVRKMLVWGVGESLSFCEEFFWGVLMLSVICVGVF